MTDKTDALVARLRMHARDCVSAADMDTDTVLSAAQIDDMADTLYEAAKALAEQPAGAVGDAWAEGYAAGVIDERTSEANIGIAGFGAKVEPARENPYTRTTPPAASVGVQTIALIANMAAYIRAEGGENAGALLSHADKLIDSAGGAKGDFCTTEGHVTGGTDSCINCGIPRPAEGDGAVEMHVRHEGSGLLALYNGDKQIREIGITPGWHFKDRDEFIFRYNNYTRPATTAAVPAFDFDRARALIGYVTGYCNATTLKTLTSDASVALGDLAAMLAAAPAAPKGEVVDEAMARRYLAAQKDYIGKVDAAFGRQVAGALHGDDVIGACMAGLTAALATPRAEQGGQEVGK